MGFVEVLTIVFIVLKLCGVITWSWIWILSPVLFTFAIYGIIFAIAIVVAVNKGR